MRPACICGIAALTLSLATGCNRSGTSSSSQGKTYTAGSKSTSKSNSSESSQSSGNGKALRTPAETTNERPSAASDNGTPEATQGQSVVNPGAPVRHEPSGSPNHP